MKSYHFKRIFSLFGRRFHFHAQSLKLPLSFTLSTFFWTYYNLSFSKPVFQISQGDITFLSKEAYFDKILGNEKDFFFLVVYTDNEEGNLHVNKVARRLKHLAEENGLEDWNVYVLSRKIFEDINKTIGRTGNVKLSGGSNEIMPVELYMKTPHSRDFMFLKHKPNKFFTAEGLEKISEIMNKASHLVHTVSTEESLRAALGESLNKFSRPTIILRINDANKVTYKKVAKKFAKLAFLSLERKYLPFDAQFIILKGANVGKSLNLEYDCPYIFRNDAIEAYERYSGETIENENEYIVVENIGGCQQKVKLEKFDNKDVKVFGRIKPKKELEEEKRKIKQKEVESFMSFLLPRVVILKDLKYRELGQLMKRCTKERRKQGSEDAENDNNEDEVNNQRQGNYKRYQERYGKYVLSLFCPSTDLQRNEKLKVFMDLYRKYKDMFVFCIIESEASQDFFPHSTSAYPCLTLFNFLNQRKFYEAFTEKNKILVYPYEKYFLNQKSPYQPDKEEVVDSIETIIQSKPQLNYLNTLNDNVQELKGVMVDEMINELKKKGEDGMFLLYDESLESLNVNRMVNKLSEELHGVKIYRMEGPNSSKDLPLIYKKYPQLVYFATRKKKVYVIEEDLMKNSKELKEFLQGIRG